MMDIIDKLLDSLKNGNYSIALILVMILLIIKSKDIYKVYQEFKKQKIERLKELQTIDNLDEETKTFIKDSLNNEVFYQLTGINADKYLKNNLIKVYESSKGIITYKDLKISQRFLKIENNVLTIEIKTGDKIEEWFNIFISIILIIIASYFFSIPSLLPNLKLLQVGLALFIGIFIYLFAGFTIAQTFPIRKAKKIKVILENLTKQSSQ